MAPEYEPFYEKLADALQATEVKLGIPNELSSNLLVEFPNKVTRKVEHRILDQKLGLFV